MEPVFSLQQWVGSCGGAAQTLTVFTSCVCHGPLQQYSMFWLRHRPSSRAHGITTLRFLCQECLFIKFKLRLIACFTWDGQEIKAGTGITGGLLITAKLNMLFNLTQIMLEFCHLALLNLCQNNGIL